MALTNPKMLVVGTAGPSGTTFVRYGVTPDSVFPVAFRKIQDAIDAVGTVLGPASDVDPYTVWVTPGTYEERIRCKPYVSIVGVNQSSCHIVAPVDLYSGPIIELASMMTLENLTIWNKLNDYAIVGHGVVGVGLNRVEVYAARTNVPRDWLAGDDQKLSIAKTLRLDGNWTTLLCKFFGGAYYGKEGYGVELIGPEPGANVNASPKPQGWTTIGWNADCHFENSFFDALYVTSEDGGAMLVRDCYEVHLRNSLLRSANNNYEGETNKNTTAYQRPARGAALRIEAAEVHVDYTLPYGWLFPLVQVILEGTHLYNPTPWQLSKSPRILDVGPRCMCVFYNGWADSIRSSKESKVHVRPSSLIGDMGPPGTPPWTIVA